MNQQTHIDQQQHKSNNAAQQRMMDDFDQDEDQVIIKDLRRSINEQNFNELHQYDNNIESDKENRNDPKRYSKQVKTNSLTNFESNRIFQEGYNHTKNQILSINQNNGDQVQNDHDMSLRLQREQFRHEHRQAVKGRFSHFDKKKHRLIRIIFISFLLFFLVMYQVIRNYLNWRIDPDVCIYDLSFSMTNSINMYLNLSPNLNNFLIIYTSALMDIMTLSHLVVWVKQWHSFKFFCNVLFFYGFRQTVQNFFIMDRPFGYTWRNPGWPSLVVPYHDINDFYYSGHVGVCSMFLALDISEGSKMGILSLFALVNMWFTLTVVRTHYFIDLVTGLLLAHYSYYLGEKVTYFFDVLMVGLSGKKRNLMHHTPCPSCGWSNPDVSQWIGKKEYEVLKKRHDAETEKEEESRILPKSEDP